MHEIKDPQYNEEEERKNGILKNTSLRGRYEEK